MSCFSGVPKKLNPKSVGYLIKIMGHVYYRMKKRYDPVTVYGDKIYSSEDSVKRCFANVWGYYCCTEKQIVCCAYDTNGIYQFSFVRDPESKKITKIEVPSHTLPEHMLYYEPEFIPGQSKYPLSLEELDEVRKDLLSTSSRSGQNRLGRKK